MLLDVADAPSDEFRTQLEGLKSGYIEEEGGILRLALEVGRIDEHETDVGPVVIRPARQADFEGVVDTIRDVTKEETYVIAESVAEQLLYEEAVSRHNTVKSRNFFVATSDGDVVGWTHLDLPRLAQVRETAQQTDGVRGAFRGLGIASQLLQRGMVWAEANGYRKIYNSIPVTNERAIEFLDAHGFETEAIRRDHYTIDDEYVDEVLMAYRF